MRACENAANEARVHVGIFEKTITSSKYVDLLALKAKVLDVLTMAHGT